MGHLTPFLRLAATISSRGGHATLITAYPTVSLAESKHLTAFLSSYPTSTITTTTSSNRIQIHPSSQDHFFQQLDAIRRSLTNLLPIFLHSSPPFTALNTDFLLADGTFSVLSHLQLPNYILCTSSASDS